MVTVISLGGSIVAPDRVDIEFVKRFADLIKSFTGKESDRHFIFVVGGGSPARQWQNAYRQIKNNNETCVKSDEEADWIGIMATRLNAQLIKAVMGELCCQEVVINPCEAGPMTSHVLVAAGWKPGFSTDYVSVVLAERFGADMVINLSNIDKIYTADPKTDPNAVPIDNITWADFRSMIGDEWIPGKNVPFDPIASRHAEKIGLKVISAGGKDLENLKNILNGKEFFGTTISS